MTFLKYLPRARLERVHDQESGAPRSPARSSPPPIPDSRRPTPERGGRKSGSTSMVSRKRSIPYAAGASIHVTATSTILTITSAKATSR